MSAELIAIESSDAPASPAPFNADRWAKILPNCAYARQADGATRQRILAGHGCLEILASGHGEYCSTCSHRFVFNGRPLDFARDEAPADPHPPVVAAPGYSGESQDAPDTSTPEPGKPAAELTESGSPRLFLGCNEAEALASIARHTPHSEHATGVGHRSASRRWAQKGIVRAALEQGNEQALAARRAMAGPASAVAGGESAADRAHTDSGESPDLSRLLHDDLHNDHGNAVRLITLHGRDLRYCYPFKKWLVWDGQRWAVDSGGQAVKIGKETMLEFLRRAVAAGDEKSEKFAKTSLDDKRIHSMLASAECELPIEVGQLDTQPDLLNFTNGTLCLRTSTLRPHEREDFITRLVHYPYSPAASAPTFLRFLARTMGGHPDASEAEFQRADRMVAYLQKAFGYSLTGSTSEKVVFFLHGSGSNGKTTLLSLFQELLQEYSTLLQVDTLMASRENNNSQADLADLRGIRYAMTSETEEGQRLAEGKLKRITQGMGRIKAVRKYENPVQFDESHKLWMDCNHKPNIKGSDNAIWNRLHLIPFTTVIPDHEVDRSLRGKLLAEAEGVLAWAVEGARRWYAEGLGRPAEIVEAVQEYRHDQDQVGRFIEECCTTIPTARANASRLYAAYVSWTEAAHEGTLTKTNFGKQMTRLDFTRGHGHSGDYYEGVGLLVKGDRDGEP